jgi:predicted DNA-binding protein (MmcQ/YjbR family)
VAGTSSGDVRAELLSLALQFPEAWEDHPWGETVAKVGKKVFVFGGVDESGVQRITVKLDESHEQALDLEGAAPAGYGLGKSGWVTLPVTSAPVGVLSDFVEESYRRIAPKRLVAMLDKSRG